MNQLAHDFKTLPADIEQEKQVLSCLLQNEKCLELLPEIHPEHFHLPAHRLIFDTIREVMAKGEILNPVSLQSKFLERDQVDCVGGPATILDLFTLAKINTPAMLRQFIDKLSEMSQRRSVIVAASEASSRAYDLSDTDFIAGVGNAFDALTAEAGQSKEPTTTQELSTEFLDELISKEAGEILAAIPTRWETFNTWTRGGIVRDSLYVIAAKPGEGKSTFAVNLANDVINAGKRCLFFSLEMSRTEVFSRMVSDRGELRNDIFVNPRLHKPTSGERQTIQETLQFFSAGNLFSVRQEDLSIEEIILIATSEARTHDLGLVVIDYLQKVPWKGERQQSREQEVAKQSAALRNFSKRTKIPVLALSQLNEDGATRESKSLEQDGTHIFKLHFEGKTKEDYIKNRKDGEGLLYCFKARSGASNVAMPFTHELGYYSIIERTS